MSAATVSCTRSFSVITWRARAASGSGQPRGHLERHVPQAADAEQLARPDAFGTAGVVPRLVVAGGVGVALDPSPA